MKSVRYGQVQSKEGQKGKNREKRNQEENILAIKLPSMYEITH